MKFKMGPSKNDPNPDISDLTSTSASSPSSNRPPQHSGIYDVSRMTNIKTPSDPFGHNVSHYTRTQGEENEKKAVANSELVRGLLLAVTVPLVAGAAYLLFSGDEITVANPERPAPHTTEQTADREPAARAALPDIDDGVSPAGELKITDVIATPASSANLNGSRPLKILLDENGNMTSPFSVELDEEGNEVARQEFSDYIVFLPSLPQGALENAKILSTASVPQSFNDAYKYDPKIPVFTFGPSEATRVSLLRSQAIEVKKLVTQNEDLVRRRTGSMSPLAVESFDATRVPPSTAKEAVAELKWMDAAVMTIQVTGDRESEKRLVATLMQWVKTYRPAGQPSEEIALLPIVRAFELVRTQLKPQETALVERFLTTLIDSQYLTMKAHKLYDPAHAAHINLTLAVGAVLGKPSYVYHSMTQFNFHVERSPLFRGGSLGTEQMRILTNLLHTAVTFERVGLTFFRNQQAPQSLAHGVGLLLNSSPSESREDYLEALAAAAYFRPDLYPLLSRVSANPEARFGTDTGVVLAAIRKPTSSLVDASNASGGRVPTAAPRRLPPKRGG